MFRLSEGFFLFISSSSIDVFVGHGYGSVDGASVDDLPCLPATRSGSRCTTKGSSGRRWKGGGESAKCIEAGGGGNQRSSSLRMTRTDAPTMRCLEFRFWILPSDCVCVRVSLCLCVYSCVWVRSTNVRGIDYICVITDFAWGFERSSVLCSSVDTRRGRREPDGFAMVLSWCSA